MTQRRPTSFDIAALAGVSQPTVSRALSGSAAVSEDTRAGGLAAAEQLNYKVDKNASGLRRRHSRTLALLFFEEWSPEGALINPFYLSLLGPMVRCCAEHGYDLLISFQQLSSDWHVDYEDSRKADGIILLGYGDYLEYRPKLAKQLRTDADPTEAAGRTAVAELLGRGVAFDAIFAAADVAAIGALHALQAIGRTVPRDLAIVGFDDIPAASLSSPPLTTVAQDPRQAAEALIEAIISSVEQGSATNRVLPVRLTVRESSVSV